MIHILALTPSHSHVYQTDGAGVILRRGCTLSVPCSCTAPLQEAGAPFVAPAAHPWSTAAKHTRYETLFDSPRAAQDVLKAVRESEALV